VDDA